MSTPINILIVEDSADDAAMMVDEMKMAGFDPVWKRVESKADFLAELEKSPDIVLSDYRMPQFSGLRAVELLSQSGRDIPLILISGTVGEDAAVEAMKLGATDYLLKDRLGRLGNAVKRAMEQKHLRAEGRQAGQQIRIQASALEAAANAILITDTRGKILWANTAACTLTGYAASELVGQNPRLLKSGQHDSEFYKDLWETVRSGQVWRGEMANRRKDGTIYHEEMTITPVRAGGGEITHFIAVKQDITEHKRAEQVLRDLSQKAAGRGRYKIAWELAVIFVIGALYVGFMAYTNWLQPVADRFVRNYQGHYDDIFNVATALFLGFAIFAYRRWKEVKSETSQQVHVKEALRLLHDELEKRIQQRTLDLVRVNEALRTEVTERKRAEEALKLFRVLVDRSNDGLEVVDPETGRLLDINETTCLRLGYRREELLSMTVMDLDTIGVNQAIWAQNVAEIRQAGSKTMEGQHRRKDGSAFPIEINVRCVKLDREYLIASVRDITERKQAEESLRKSQEQLRLLIEQAPICIAMFDRDLRYIITSRRWISENGRGYENLTGRSHYETHPDIPARWKEAHQKGLAGEFLSNDEDVWVQADGKTLWLRWALHPWRNAEGEIGGIIISTEDITERKRAGEALRESQALYHSLVEQMPAGIFRKDAEGRYAFANAWYCQHKGAKAEDMLGKTPGEFARHELAGRDPEGAPETKSAGLGEEHHWTIMQTGKTIENEEEYVHPIEGKMYFQAVKSPVFGPDGKIIGSQGILMDITGLKLAEEGLRESEEKFRQLAENIQEVFWMASPDFRQIYYVSTAYEKIWGRTCASLYASPLEWEEAIHPEDKKHVREAIAEKLPLGEFNVEYRIIRPDKSVRWIHDQGFPVRTAQGVIYRIVGTAEDITERRLLEEQFRQSQKMEAIGQLASGVAHDFNNVLAVIQMQAVLMETGAELSKEQSEHVKDIGDAVQRAAALTRQLLMFSRRQVMQARDLDLSESTTNMTKMLRRVLGEDIQSQFRFTPQPLIVHADPGMLDQVLMNLVVNSRDAMPQGGQLIIETSAVEFDEQTAGQTAHGRPGSFACLSVSDTGCGIPQENMARIFEPFYTTKEVGKGTGLGLATVFGIIQQHRGWVNVYSEVGYGTTFRIYLPRQERSMEQGTERSDFASLRGGKETILLVEDDAILRVSAGKAVARLGYRVLEAGNGSEALKIWKQHHSEISLLLTDMLMPGGMTGKDLAELLLKENPKLKVIYTSGYSAELAGRNFPLEEGVNFLTKPFEAHKLARTIRARLDEVAAG